MFFGVQESNHRYFYPHFGEFISSVLLQTTGLKYSINYCVKLDIAFANQDQYVHNHETSGRTVVCSPLPLLCNWSVLLSTVLHCYRLA